MGTKWPIHFYIDTDTDFTAYDDPATWPELVARAEQVCKEFTMRHNVTWPTKEIDFSKYKELKE